MAQAPTREARAHALALSAHYAAAIVLYDSVLAADPRNWDAAISRALTVAWSGRLAESESDYRGLIDSGAGPDAVKGLARVVAWRGRLAESDSLYRSVVARDTTDAEAYTGLAQILQWEGRPREARAALERAIAAHPDDPDARAAMATLRPVLSASLRPAVTTAGDNEHNTSVAGTVAGDAPAPWGRWTFASTYVAATGLAATGSAFGARLGAGWSSLGEIITLRGEAGFIDVRGTAPGVPLTHDLVTAVGAAHASVRVGASTLTAGLWRDAYDETAALIAHGIMQTATDAEATVILPAGVHADAQAAYVGLSGGTRPNERMEGSMYVWSPTWRIVSVGAGTHGYGYLRPDSTDGYFVPASFILTEGVVRAATARDHGLNALAEIGVGAQRIAAFGKPGSVKPAERVAGSLTYRFMPGVECGLSAGYTVAASPYAVSASEAAGYRGYALAVTAKLIP